MAKCTWVIEAHYSNTPDEDGERVVIPAKKCGKQAIVDFNRHMKKKGRVPYIEHNIRCRVHATQAAYDRAGLDGYEATSLLTREK